MLTDFLILAGAALCLLSVPMAVISLLATRPPRGAAIVFVLGCLVLLGAAMLAPEGFGWSSLADAWRNLTATGMVETTAPAN